MRDPLTKRYDDPIEVELDGYPGELRPLAFFWRGRRYAVQHLLTYWREAGEGWDPNRARDHECFRVEARNGSEVGVYDLRYDRLACAGHAERAPWRLARVWD